MAQVKILAAACVALAALAATGGAQAAACATFGSVSAGTSSTSDVTYNGGDSDACVISEVNPQQGGGNTSGFDPAWGSGWSVLATVDSSGNITNSSDFGVSLTGVPGTSGSWTLTSDQGATLDLVFAMHASNASGAFLFDDLSLVSGGTGTWEINWLNKGGNVPNYSNLTLFTRDVVVTPPVPEPETYALMLAGLAAVGFVARRRKV